jgi:hypothetical protein
VTTQYVHPVLETILTFSRELNVETPSRTFARIGYVQFTCRGLELTVQKIGVLAVGSWNPIVCAGLLFMFPVGTVVERYIVNVSSLHPVGIVYAVEVGLPAAAPE